MNVVKISSMGGGWMEVANRSSSVGPPDKLFTLLNDVCLINY